MRAPEDFYFKGIGSGVSPRPLTGPDEGSIVEIFELISVWAETAHFQPQLLGDNGGAISPTQMKVGT